MGHLSDFEPLMVFKICTCCGRTFSKAAWAELPSLGVMPGENAAGEPCGLELKNCTCQSTLAVEVPAQAVAA
jgi:hypothetical protein